MKTYYIKIVQFIIVAHSFSVTAQQPSLLTVDGKHLKDDCGETIILKGLNHGNIYDVSDFGVGEIAEIEKTGANAVRLVVETHYCTFPPPDYDCVEVPTTATQLSTMIAATLDANMIPVVELHDYTGSANPGADLVAAANWWTQPAILNVLIANQHYLILNIANEPSSANYPPSAGEQTAYFNANVSAITILRNAGLTCPIMIDGMHWGKDHTFFINHGAQLTAADPLHKLLFSIHAYWPSSGNAVQLTDTQITNYMNTLASVNAPIVLGEIAHAEVQQSGTFPISYTLLLDLCQTHDFGYLIWWWGQLEPGSSSPLYISTNGLFTSLTAEGNVFAHTHANALTTAVRPAKLVSGACEELGVGDLESKKNAVLHPNPFQTSLSIDAEYEIEKIEVFNSEGQKLLESTTNNLSTGDLPKGMYFIVVYSGEGVETLKAVKK